MIGFPPHPPDHPYQDDDEIEEEPDRTPGPDDVPLFTNDKEDTGA